MASGEGYSLDLQAANGMGFSIGQLVEHTKFGLGKVLSVAGDVVAVWFAGEGAYE